MHPWTSLSTDSQLSGESLIIGEEEVPLKKLKASKEPNYYKAVVTEGVCLPPLAETVVPVRVDGAQADYHWGLLEQPTGLFDSLLVARMLVDLQRKEVPLRVMNLSYQQQVIRKGTELACCETIHSVLASRVDIEKGMLTGCTQNAKILVQLAPHLKELYERSVATLDETECQEVYTQIVE